MDQVKNRSGQAVLEYILLLSIVIFLFTTAMRIMSERDWFAGLTSPLTRDFKFAYQYGHPEARGPADGGQKNIAQHPENFRIFINPSTRK